MNLGRLPLSDSFALAWEQDDKFDRERFDREHAEDLANNVTAAEVREGFEKRYENAYKRLDWQPLCREGERPTLFWFRPVVGKTLHRLIDMDRGSLEKSALAFRLGLTKIDNGPSGLARIEQKPDADYRDLGPMLTAECFEQLALFGRLVIDLGNMVIHRSTNLSPLG